MGLSFIHCYLFASVIALTAADEW